MGPASKNLSFAGLTDIGLLREENQDNYGIYDGTAEAPDKGLLLLVADGMGGEAGGATASKMAVDIILEHYSKSDGTDPAAVLREAFQITAESIFQKSQREPGLSGMGTTGTALAVIGGRGTLAHVGDSRAYRIRGGKFEQLTRDHTWVREMMDRGMLSEEDAKVHPQRNVLTQALGSESSPTPQISPEPLRLEPGDSYLLCSDGLWGLVSDDEMLQITAEAGALETACARLVDLARQRGGHDNITVVLLEIPKE